MFLKRIQLSGFKSFADKITIPLDKGITGIVGPNGSGKSNVIDAVRWVMGEQSAKSLRGKVATDIIFSGSARRKPVGMAEVSLVFDNADASGFCPPEYRHEPEISLTRRLYADGQREYLINKKQCRLKDIINFFTTTGLGGRSYSMIEQGQVDRILNAKPEDVRIILEEAAGTLVFKIRRDEAFKKLANTKENLSRIEDILAELDRQQQSLKGQMEKAQEWRDLSTRLKDEELTLFAHNFHNFNDQLLKLRADLDTNTAAEAENLAKLAVLEARQVELQNALDDADPNLEGLREQVSIIREDIARAESIIMSADDRVANHKKRLEDLEKEVGEDSENAKIIEAQMDASTSELNLANKAAVDLRDMIESFQEQVDAVDEQGNEFLNRIEDFESELKNIDRLLDANTMRCETINRERAKTNEEIKILQERLETLEAERRSIAKELETTEARAAEKQQGLDLELQQKAALETALKSREEAVRSLAGRRDELKEQYFNARGRFTSLQELEISSSDVATSYQTLVEKDATAEDLTLGMLTDFIAFNDAASEISPHARSCFEKWAERLLVDNLESLNELARIAHKHSLGGLPVLLAGTAGKDNREAIAAWVDTYEATPLRSFLKITKDSGAIQKLLDKLFLLPGLELSAAEVAALPPGVIAFSSQGIRFSNSEEFTIGIAAGAKGILSRKEELEELTKSLKEVEASLAGCQSEIDTLELKQGEDRRALNEIDGKLRGQNQDVLEVVGELQAARQLLEHKLELLEATKGQIERLDKADAKGVEDLSEQGQARISLGQEQERITGELNALREEAETIEERRAEVFRMHENRKLDLAKSEARAQALQQSFQHIRSQMERVQQVLSRRYEEKARVEQEIAQIASDFQRAKNDIAQLIGKRETLETELSSKREANSAILEDLRHADAELKVVREALGKIQKFSSDKSVAMERLKFEHESIVAQAQEKYHLDIQTYQFEVDPDFNGQRRGQAVQKLRNKIEGLGAINMMAIEEYDQLMQRHEFISAQKLEVVNSISILEEALEEIEETTKVKFLETFATVSAEFTNLFPVLFPGGEARLELTAPDDPLNTGAEILARLPGKKMQRMTLLSGGEKALTAISLIFALLKTKPTPFCFLDEVDAPLDEGNVGRYNRVLETLSERFQFIVITHNRRTMEALDTLFGVTMQEPGVSKIVGVDMQKDLPAHLQKAFKETTPSRPVEGATSAEVV